MKFEFINDFKDVVWKDGDIVYCVPVDSLTEEEKEYIYAQAFY